MIRLHKWEYIQKSRAPEKKYEKYGKVWKKNCQNIHVCKIYTMNVEMWKRWKRLSSKLSTWKNPQKAVKVELSSKLSTLSTKFTVDSCDLHNEIKNKGFVHLS